MKAMDRLSYQQKAWRRNRHRIIGILNQESLTFTELIEKSGLSRAVVHEHLKDLLEDGSVRKIYKDGRILNVLQLKKVNLVEWFLHQLEAYDLPTEVIAKGRVVLNDHILINASMMYGYILNNITSILEGSELGEAAETDKKPWLLESFSLVPSKMKAQSFKLDIESHVKIGSEQEKEIVHKLIRELNPHLFNVIMVTYELEKRLGSKELKKRDVFFYSTLSKEVKRSLDEVSEWWFKEVSEYLPSSRLFQLLTIVYSNSLSSWLRKKRLFTETG